MSTSFDLKVGWLCNNKCIHCVVKGKEKKSGDYTTEEIKKIIVEDSKSDAITFTGGEPTVRKDFIELLEFCKEVGIKNITIQSNGRMFKRRDFAEKVSELANSVLFTIHSHNEEVHDSITRIPGSWENSVEGLKNLHDIGKIYIVSQTVLSKLNIEDLHKTYDFIQELAPGIRMNITFPHPNGAAGEDFYNVVPRYSDVKDEFQIIFEKYGKLLNSEAIPYCYMYPHYHHVNIREYEMVKNAATKLRGIDGSFSEKGIIDDYSKLISSEYRKPETCKECIFNDSCLGVWKEYFYGYQDCLDLYPIKA